MDFKAEKSSEILPKQFLTTWKKSRKLVFVPQKGKTTDIHFEKYQFACPFSIF